MNIVLTYDPRWKYTPKGHTPFWASLDTVDFVIELLEDTKNNISLIKADNLLETNLIEMKNKHPESLVFWLNEFMATGSGRDKFTVEVIEKARMMYTGPSSEALGIGLNKETTKNVFRRLGLPTPESYVVYPGNYSPIHQSNQWNGHALIKPLLQGNSRGIDEFSVVHTNDFESIQNRVERIHQEFNEPALVEEYIGGTDAKEYSAPAIISFDGRIGELPLTEIDLSQIPAAQGEYRFLTNAIKDEKYYLKIPAILTNKTCDSIRTDVRSIIKEIGCRDMTRIDMRCNSTGLYYVEVNVNPGKNKFSYLIMSAYSLGFTYRQIIAFIPYQAMLKYGFEPPRKLEELVYPMTTLFEPSSDIEGVARKQISSVH
jgi:D-alanine-D-alanine ligase